MGKLRIVGHMMCRNEADVIRETVLEALKWVDTLIVLDGCSTDGTWEKLEEIQGCLRAVYPEGKMLELHMEPDPGDRFADTIRNRLLELTAPHEPDWVISVDADEIYHDWHAPYISMNPSTAIQAAERVGANVVRCLVPQFWLTFQDLREGALWEDETPSVQQRRRWYSWGWKGTFIWRWNPEHYYPPDMPKRTPELPGKTWREWQRGGPMMPVCKHYPFRSLRQAMARAEERLERGGGRYFGKYRENWIVDERIAGLHHLGPDEVWDIRDNHQAVYDYMGRKHTCVPEATE